MIQQKSFQLNHSGPHMHPVAPRKSSKAATTPSPAKEPDWYHIDANGIVVGRLATLIADLITGKHKPTFTRHADAGDFVVVTNIDKVVFTKDKWLQKKYYRHTGWMGGLKSATAREMLERKPEEILKKAVWGMTNKSRLAKRQLGKLKLFVGDQHSHQAQNPQPLPEWVKRHTVLQASKAAN